LEIENNFQFCDNVSTVSNIQDKWNNIVETCTTCAINTAGQKPRNPKYIPDKELQHLSDIQHKLRLDINSTCDIEIRKSLKKERNRVLKSIKKLKKQKEVELLDKNIEHIKNCQNDSRRMYEAVRTIHKKEPDPVIVHNKDGEFVTSAEEKVGIITNFFESLFCVENTTPFEEIPPCKLTIPFTSVEIKKSVNKLRNGKSTGCDNLPAELVKNAPDIIHQEIADILNIAAETGEHPKELKHGLLLPLPKPKKPKGPCKSLRPIVLLSILRKILAICFVQRTFDRIRKAINVSQAAYSPGRGASELIFTFKLLAERAITSDGYDLYILMLDMSRAFDTIQRGTLIQHLKCILEPDELHLVSLLIKDVTLQVKCDNHTGRVFTTNIGSPQGDCASPILFIYILSVALKKSKELINSYSVPRAIHNIENDHTFSKNSRTSNTTKSNNTIRKEFSIGQEYADDCSFGSTNNNLINEIESTVPGDLSEFNLCVNCDKTEKAVAGQGDSTEWKNTLLLGSKLGTEEDINRRKGLASAAFDKYSFIITNKALPLYLRVTYFVTFVNSIFLYNCGLWTLTTKLEYRIDVFQRLFLRRILGVRYPKKITNIELYKVTKQEPWSTICRRRRLTLFGHICRLPEQAPARITLQEVIRPVKHMIGGQRLTYIRRVKSDFHKVNISIEQAQRIAQDKKDYRALVRRVMSC
jgi:hypothetical protein